ncbi:MAG: hypothetical protein LBU53_14005 [Zoogloeaceae bacterium]|jgi:hypothetical protein|nr:hypothetical protein [Zoogloeaceae bacterium]
MNKQILAAVAVVAGLVAGTAHAEGFFEGIVNAIKGEPQQTTETPAPAANVPATPVVLTPEQLKAKATLEKVVMCQQKYKYPEVIKLAKSLPGTIEENDDEGVTSITGTSLQPWGVNVESVYFYIGGASEIGFYTKANNNITGANFAKKAGLKRQGTEGWNGMVYETKTKFGKLVMVNDDPTYIFVKCNNYALKSK